MAAKTDAYVDTSAFVAFLDRSDSYHPLFRQLFGDPPRLTTSSLVIAEGQAWFLRRYDSMRALQFMNFIEDLKPLTIARTGPKELGLAHRLLRKFSDQPLTLADAAGMALMQQGKIGLCWSTDRHLSLAGARLVIH